MFRSNSSFSATILQKRDSAAGLNARLLQRLKCFLVCRPILIAPLIPGSARPFLWSFIVCVFPATFAFPLLRSPSSAPLPASPHRCLSILSGSSLAAAALSPQRAEWLRRSYEATGMFRLWASLSYVLGGTFMNGAWILTLALLALVLHTVRCGTGS